MSETRTSTHHNQLIMIELMANSVQPSSCLKMPITTKEMLACLLTYFILNYPEKGNFSIPSARFIKALLLFWPFLDLNNRNAQAKQISDAKLRQLI